MSRAVPEADVVGQIIVVGPEQIDASDRLLPIDDAWADAVGAMMKANGQLTPIVVRRLPGRADYKLVEGGHRHAGAIKHGLKLEARVVGADALQARLREASENLDRRTLSPFDQAKATAELIDVQKALLGVDADRSGRSVSASIRWQDKIGDEAEDANATIALAYGWADEAAEKAGVSRRTIYNRLELIRRIPASIAEALRRADHPVFHNAAQLKALAGLEPAEQRKALGLLLHADAVIKGAPFDKVTDAIGAIRGRSAPAPDAKRLSAFIGTFGRMPVTEKKGALAQLGPMLPKGWSLVEGDVKPALPVVPVETLETIDLVRELLDGLIEDEKLDDERHSIAEVLTQRLEATRLKLGGAA